jgi:hypothetical protein
MAESSATKSMKQMLRTRGVAVAAVTAGAVGAWLFLQNLLRNIINLITISTTSDLYEVDYGAYIWADFLSNLIVFVLPITLGIFLSLWLVAPISEVLGIGHVITRSVLAVGIGSTLYFVFQTVADIIGAIAFDRPLFSNSFPGVVYDGPRIVFAITQALQSALVTFVSLLPLVVLAGVLLWHWRKANPPEFHVQGLIDV